jgi:hypothetical protein
MKPNIQQQFADALSKTGVELQQAGAEVALFAAQRGAHVAAAANEPGLDQVMRDEQDRVFLFAAGRAVRSGDAADAQAWGLIHGFLIGVASA